MNKKKRTAWALCNSKKTTRSYEFFSSFDSYRFLNHSLRTLLQSGWKMCCNFLVVYKAIKEGNPNLPNLLRTQQQCPPQVPKFLEAAGSSSKENHESKIRRVTVTYGISPCVTSCFLMFSNQKK